MPAVDPLTFPEESPGFAVSADGSTFAVVDPNGGGLEGWIKVYDGLGGDERGAIPFEEPLYISTLSADGTRLVAAPSMMCGPSGCGPRTWYTFDTTSGDLISKLVSDKGEPAWSTIISADGTRLYEPVYDRPAEAPATLNGPWPLLIAVHDLETGSVITHIPVPGVIAGSWQADSTEGYVGYHEYRRLCWARTAPPSR